RGGLCRARRAQAHRLDSLRDRRAHHAPNRGDAHWSRTAAASRGLAPASARRLRVKRARVVRLRVAHPGRSGGSDISPPGQLNGRNYHMKLKQLVIAALAVSSAGAMAAANPSSSTATQPSDQSYTSPTSSQANVSSQTSASSQSNSQVSQAQQALND